MVYGGKPSRGCGTCKKRKIKCDEGRPTCTQCQKSSRVCLGYKDEADYIFRNQTEKVTSRITKARKPRASKSPDSTSSKESAVTCPKAVTTGVSTNLPVTFVDTDTYGKAMRIAAAALQDPVQATSDETLQATLLLCLYESIKATDHSIDAWSNHVEGASAIVQSRGTKQLETEQSLALFRAARTHMLINCIRQGKPTRQLEAGMDWLCDTTEDDPLAYLTHCTIELPSLMEKTRRVCERQRNDESMADMEALIERACHLEAT
ncbi:hypothetical protein KCV01_g23762, partial [Aureobasidium melanogenum]